MVKYWKTQNAVKAKVTKAKEGHYIMIMEGEKYPFPGYPRGNLLFGTLSKLKHEIKNQIFNDTWKDLEAGTANLDKVLNRIDNIIPLIDEARINMVPYEKMNPPVKEIYRALSEVEKKFPGQRIGKLKEALCYILQEDDAYRFRVQWMAKFLTWGRVKNLEKALKLMEHAEIVGDMKERVTLLRRILLFIASQPELKDKFNAFLKEVDWKKVKLTKADKYFFRAKYFRVDYPLFEY